MLPSYVVYKAKNLYDGWTEGGPAETWYNATSSGWMDEPTFFDWLTKLFIPAVADIDGGKLLFFDGHGSHISLRIVETCRESNVHLVCLIPHSSHILQPLDVSVFKPMKTVWRNLLKSHYRETRLSKLNKEAFPKLLSKLYDSLKPQNLIKGFMACGLFPIDQSAVKVSRLAPSLPFVREAARNRQPQPHHAPTVELPA